MRSLCLNRVSSQKTFNKTATAYLSSDIDGLVVLSIGVDHLLLKVDASEEYIFFFYLDMFNDRYASYIASLTDFDRHEVESCLDWVCHFNFSLVDPISKTKTSRYIYNPDARLPKEEEEYVL